MSKRLDTYELNLAPGRTFNAPIATIPTDLGPAPLLSPPPGYQAQSVAPSPTRPGAENGISNFLVDQDVSCVDPWALYNRQTGGMIWISAMQLTVDESAGAMGGAFVYMGRPNQSIFQLQALGPGEAANPLQGCIAPIPPGWVIYVRVNDGAGNPLPGEHKLVLALVGMDDLCNIACAIKTSGPLRDQPSLPGSCPEVTGFDNGTGGIDLGIGPGQTGTVTGSGLNGAYTLELEDIDGVTFPVTPAGLPSPGSVPISVDTTGAAAGAGLIRCIPDDLLCPVTTTPVNLV